MKLLLVRHAKAVHPSDWNDVGQADQDRPLTKAGVQKFSNVVYRLRAAISGRVHIFSSPTLRTLATAHIFAEGFGADQPKVLSALTQNTSMADLERVLLKKLSVKSTLVLVGHENHLAKIVAFLLEGNAFDVFHFKKGGCAMLDIAIQNQKLRAQLLWMITPNFLLRLPDGIVPQ